MSDFLELIIVTLPKEDVSFASIVTVDSVNLKLATRTTEASVNEPEQYLSKQSAMLKRFLPSQSP